MIIPWIAGVFCGERLFGYSAELLWGMVAFGVLSALAFALYSLERYRLRWCFGVVVALLCFTGGWTSMTWQLQQTVYTFPQEATVYRAVVTDAPQAKERTYLCRVWLKEQRDSTGTHPVERKAILYLEQDSAAGRLKNGDELLVSARISPPINNKNFDEFDYARYLMRKGISGTGYVASGKWVLHKATGNSSLREVADACRRSVIALYRKLGFEGDELAVLSALTIGDKTELSESVRESYSVAGASHILALSGLHIGLLYALFFYLLRPVAKRGKGGRCLRAVLGIALLWAFAFLTGFSPSVVRSAAMFSILALADVFGRQPFSINTLAATAWFMLLCHPVWLFDVGFQLSFIAVAFIMLMQPPIYRLLAVESRAGKYVWGLMSVSIAAQIGTAPLVMLYFSRFSTHFLLTNIVVIPLITVILYAAVAMLVLTPVAWLQAWIAEGVKKLLEGLNLFVRWVERLPYSSIDGIWLYRLEVLGIYIFLSLLTYYLFHRRYKNLIACLSALLIVGIAHAAMAWIDRPQASLVFYNVRGCPAVHCIESDGRSWINYADTLPDTKLLQRVATNYWNHHRLLPPEEITGDSLHTAFIRQQQVVSFHGYRICMVTDNRWLNKSAATPLSIHCLYLCRGYDGRLKELTALFAPGCIVLDASLPEYRRQLLEDECKQSGLRFISLAEEGSVRFVL